MSAKTQFVPGMRTVIRDAEWIIRRVDKTRDGGQVLTVDGTSELVCGTSALFLTELENKFDPIQILQPENTGLTQDLSPGFRKSLLFVETCLRRSAPNDGAIHIAHKAAMKVMDYQFKPARTALAQPRQRILIADAVGLGKTLEAGILVSELIHRGRGKRILVLSLKSMLTQFQKEFWSRFSIPLTRLDSVGIARVSRHLPQNHNPFYFYDKTIISIDTLKHNRLGKNNYRNFLEHSFWDIIIIDEAHNVAERANRSERNRLADLLATRSDTLIMLSATPHDGRARSFASLINMLDPTAISDPETYRREDYADKGLVIRRFKKDILLEAKDSFPEREVQELRHGASLQEEAAYAALLDVQFVGKSGTPTPLVRLTLQKALFSSPAAAMESLQQRQRLLDARRRETGADERALGREWAGLQALENAVAAIGDHFQRYQALLQLLRSKAYNWTRKEDDRLVIFSERLATIHFLREHLSNDLGLKNNQVAIITGSGMGDQKLQEVVEKFGRLKEPVRLLLATDVASEGINLHYCCHRIIHFDLPWSLMSFQQRNGRIDRFGQRSKPLISYLITQAENPTIRGDQRILEVLVKKDQKAYEDIGDPQVFMGVYDQEQEEALTTQAMANRMDATTFDATYNGGTQGTGIAKLLANYKPGTAAPAPKASNTTPIQASPSLFDGDAAYARAALEQLREHQPQLSFNWDNRHQTLTLQMPEDLEHRFRHYPRELMPTDRRLVLSADPEAITQEIERCRQDEHAWPTLHHLWGQHPVLRWLDERMAASFGRHTAPVLALQGPLQPGQTSFVISAAIPNLSGHPLVQAWLILHFRQQTHTHTEDFASFLPNIPFSRLANAGQEISLHTVRKLLPEAVSIARSEVRRRYVRFIQDNETHIQQRITELDRMEGLQEQAYEQRLANSRDSAASRESKRSQQRQSRQNLFESSRKWVRQRYRSDGQPFLQVVCVLHRAEA